MTPHWRFTTPGYATRSCRSSKSNPFTTLHVAMVLAATGQHDRQQTLLSAVNTLVNEHDSSLATAYSGVPEVLDFIAAHRAGQHKQVAARGASSRDSLWRLGGSHAQRDVLFQLLFDSASRCQDHALINGIHVDLERTVSSARRRLYLAYGIGAGSPAFNGVLGATGYWQDDACTHDCNPLRRRLADVACSLLTRCIVSIKRNKMLFCLISRMAHCILWEPLPRTRALN